MGSLKNSGASQLSIADLQWLHKTIGIDNLEHDNKLNSADYVSAIEHHLDTNVECSLNAKNAKGNTALHLVAISENYQAINGLLQCGAEVNATNDFGQTPITYSENCPDFNVGFHFFRHLHKLSFLKQHINEANARWYYKACAIYNQRYPQGYITAFTHDPFLGKQTISKIRAGGETVIIEMYKNELRKIPNTRTIKNFKLNNVVNVTDRKDVTENRLEELRNCMERKYFSNAFPLLGCMFKLKYRRSLQNLKNRQIKNGKLPKSPSDESLDERLPTNVDWVKSLKNETEQQMKEFLAGEDLVIPGLIKHFGGAKTEENINGEQLNVESLPERKVTAAEQNGMFEMNSDEKVEKMRRLLARLPRPGLST